MKPTNHPKLSKRLRAALVTTALLVGGTALAAYGGSSTAAPAATAAPVDSTVGNNPVGTSAGSSSPVLPVSANPITNTSTVEAMTIDSVLVENNVDAAGRATSDHLEIALTNTGTAELTSFEVYYTFSGPTTNTTESYYAQLPASFTIAAGESRIAHFDNTGAVDHFPVSDFSLYYTDTNALDVTVTVSASDAAIQTSTIQKDAGGQTQPTNSGGTGLA